MKYTQHGNIGTWHYKAEWKPSSDVIAYFPLDSEYQLNSYDGTKSLIANGTAYIFSDNCVELQTTSTYLIYESSGTNTYTIFGYMYGAAAGRYGISSTGSFSGTLYGRSLYRNGDTSLTIQRNNGSTSNSTSFTISAGWHCIVMVANSSAAKVYVDGVLVGTHSSGLSVTTQKYLLAYPVTGGYKISRFGLSNSEWTDAQVADFYNKTKSDFGL